MIDEKDFTKKADAAFEDLKKRLLTLGDEHGFDVEGESGKLEVIFEEPEEAKFVISPNTPVREIWISALSTSFKLGWSEARNAFVLEKTGEDLRARDEPGDFAATRRAGDGLNFLRANSERSRAKVRVQLRSRCGVCASRCCSRPRNMKTPRAAAQVPSPKDVVAPAAFASYDPVARGKEFQIAVVMKIRDGFHVNARKKSAEYLIATDLKTDGAAGFKIGDVTYPEGETAHVYVFQDAAECLREDGRSEIAGDRAVGRTDRRAAYSAEAALSGVQQRSLPAAGDFACRCHRERYRQCECGASRSSRSCSKLLASASPNCSLMHQSYNLQDVPGSTFRGKTRSRSTSCLILSHVLSRGRAGSGLTSLAFLSACWPAWLFLYR